MSKKSQAQILREVFHFGFGLIFLISLFYFTYNYLIPRIEEYSLIYQAENLAWHANYLISSIYESTNNALIMAAENEYSMPEKIWEYEYMIFMQEGSVCCAISGQNIEACVPLIVSAEIQGVFFSGGKMRIFIDHSFQNSLVTLTN